MDIFNEFSYRYGCGILIESEETREEYFQRVGNLDIEEGEPEF